MHISLACTNAIDIASFHERSNSNFQIKQDPASSDFPRRLHFTHLVVQVVVVFFGQLVGVLLYGAGYRGAVAEHKRGEWGRQ